MKTEQERAAFEAWLGITPCGSAHDLAWEAWQARAAIEAAQPTVSVRSADELIAVIRDWLEQDNPAHYGPFEKRLVAIIDGEPDPALEADRKRRGEVVVTKTPEGEIVAVTRQDDEGRILSVIAEADRQRSGELKDTPSDADLHRLAYDHCDETDASGQIERFSSVGTAVEFARDVLRLYGNQSRGEPVDIRQEVIETLEIILAADWRKWEELASPDEFVRWAKARANYALSIINEAPQPDEPSGAPTLHNKDSGAQDGTHAPQPAEQQTDVAQLVVALERMVKWYENISLGNNPAFQYYDLAKKALAAYRKQGVNQ